jgi:hypothetical protein
VRDPKSGDFRAQEHGGEEQADDAYRSPDFGQRQTGYLLHMLRSDVARIFDPRRRKFERSRGLIGTLKVNCEQISFFRNCLEIVSLITRIAENVAKLRDRYV